MLEVVYLIFTEGYAASVGEDWMRPALCLEALRLGRILTGLAPLEPEVHGLVSLMELQASRLASRTDATGAPVLLADQDRSAWNPWYVRRGFEALDRAVRLSVITPRVYEDLARLTGSAVVELNRAAALGMASGPQAGLILVDQSAATRLRADARSPA